jgi:hypothetical protein
MRAQLKPYHYNPASRILHASPLLLLAVELSVCFEPFEVGFVDRPLSFLLPPFVPAVRLQRSCVSTV